MSRGHKRLEKNIILMSVFIVVAVSLGGLVEILPLIFQDQVITGYSLGSILILRISPDAAARLSALTTIRFSSKTREYRVCCLV